MRRRNRVYRLLVCILLPAIIIGPTSWLPAPTSAQALPAGGMAFAVAPVPVASGVYRTTVTVSSPARRARLAGLVAAVLSESDGQAIVLADAEQLEALARLRFEPQASDDVAVLVAGAAKTQPGLAQSLQPLLAQAVSVQKQREADETGTPEPGAQSTLRAALAALSLTQQAALAAMGSVDGDGDGLSNTQEAWWCTDPDSPDSDGDGARDGDEVNALKDWLSNRRAGPPSTGKPFSGWPPQIAGCVDDDQDAVPDMAERWDLGLNMNRESTDRDKFDDGQELYGLSYCPGSGGYCGYGALPRNEDWGVIFAEMPAWVKAPGNHPLVAAFPIPKIDVVESSLRVQTVAVITTDHLIGSGTEQSYSTARTQGTSTSVANTQTWNEWQEVTESLQQHVPTPSQRVQAKSPDSINVGKLVGGTLQVVGGAGGIALACGGGALGTVLTGGLAGIAAAPLCVGALGAGPIAIGSGISDLGDAFPPRRRPTAEHLPAHRRALGEPDCP